MSIPSKITSLFEAMTPADLDELSPIARQRFAQACMHWGKLADRPPNDDMCAVLHAEGEAIRQARVRKTEGVLARLGQGERAP